MVTKDKRPRPLYHYTSMDAALEIVESQKLSMSGHKQFNDPFDCEVPFATTSLIRPIADEVRKYLKDSNDGKPTKYDDLQNFKQLMSETRQHLSSNPQSFDHFFDSIIERRIEEVGSLIKTALQQVSNPEGHRLVAACFSDSPTNLSLWGHYAKAHTGAALEFEFPSEVWNQNLFEIEYSSDKPNWLTTAEWCDLLFRHPETYESIISEEFLKKSFTVKSSDWEKEQEVRYVGFEQSGSNANRPSLDFPTNWLSRVLIGFKADSKHITAVCKRKRIPVARMQRAKEEFAVYAVPAAGQIN